MYLAWEDHRLLWDHGRTATLGALKLPQDTTFYSVRIAGLPYPTEIQDLHWCHSMRRHDWTKSQLQCPMRLVAEGCISTLAGRSNLLGSENSWNRRLFLFSVIFYGSVMLEFIALIHPFQPEEQQMPEGG